MIGAKVVEIEPGHRDRGPVADDGRIAARRVPELADLLAQTQGMVADVREGEAAVTDRRDLLEYGRGVGRERDPEPLGEPCHPGELVRARGDHRPPLALQPSLQVDGRAIALEEARPGKDEIGEAIDAEAADDLGLVTFTPDDIDWEDEVRLVLEERAGFSPDGLIGMEANLRFAGPETMETKIFARLSAWQNWIFQRPNATGPEGALKLYGSGSKPQFDLERV